MIQFGTPWILWGLLTAAAPIIIHLFGKKRTKEVEFSSLRFLKSMQREQIRTLKLKQILLLILRTLLLILLVLAFAGPRYAPSSSQGVAHSSALILLDNSISTSKQSNGTVYFTKLKRLAENLIRRQNYYDQVVWTSILSDEGPQTTSQTEIPSLYLEELTPKHGRVDLERSLSEIRTWLNEQNTNNVDVYLFTDGQAPQFNALQNIDLGEWGNSRWFVISPEAEMQQVGIQSTDFSTELLQPDSFVPLKLNVVRNDSSGPASTGIRIFKDNEKIGQSLISWENTKSKAAQFEIPVSKQGFFNISVALENDQYDADNHWYANGAVPSNLDILIISDSRQEAFFLEAAIKSLINTNRSITYDVVTSDQVFQHLESSLDLILVSDVVFSEDVQQMLHSMIQRGTGLMLFPGNNFVQQEASNMLNGLNPYGQLVQLNEGTFQQVSEIRWTHPVFQNISEEEIPEIELPRIFKYFRMDGQTGEPLMTLDNGEFFLQETRIGEGKVWLWHVAPSLEWSDFPRRGLFLPVLIRGFYYLSGSGGQYNGMVNSGESLIFPIPEHLDASELTLINPEGQSAIVPVVSGEARYENARIPGHYSFYKGDTLVAMFSVNVPSEERVIEYLSENEWQVLFQNDFGGMLQVTDDENIRTANLVRGRPLHQWLFALALCCVILEMIIARSRVSAAKGNQS